MRFLRKTLICTVWTLLVALGQYELAAKSGPWLDTPLPGSRAAMRAERETPFRPWTRIPAVDRLLHEGREAAAYYGRLLR
ncbi:MAG TPA: hypothetical protein P5571_13475 [Candidatus Krumholzibacteria bacterium]|mgnify:CR=1 FL=1|nr:hypothetical protein [Candidatus Krumholzibacteria bacterium]HRX52374.1 hypothetical protein [Candidatus Krumholzibacteria bacterium]